MGVLYAGGDIGKKINAVYSMTDIAEEFEILNLLTNSSL